MPDTGRNGTPFLFSIMPEQIAVKYGTKYQTFDTISRGTVKVPRGTDVTSVSWSSEFFGFKRRNEPIVNRLLWMPLRLAGASSRSTSRTKPC